ncbi:FecR family protein [Sphingobacterium yanglingense]|uniref:FecR family protein n=1 Tax=Sphingobacterium yanglingense TaxID=1437280 RepID=A0A4R6WIQ5_9SPHI|nr:FecR family protein [Sphingobacterium yanglingense]TDQ80170.1 FecR family protein [Sphingobacterium yanglingense]
MHTPEYYQLLANKWLDGTISDLEKAEFANWYNQNNKEDIDIPPDFAENEELLQNRILEKVLSKIALDSTTPKLSRIKRLKPVLIAASILLVSALGITIYHAKMNTEKAIQQAISPGAPKALLSLSNGKQFNLDQLKDGELLHTNGIHIVKKGNSEIIINISDNEKAMQNNLINNISTPAGGEYKIQLADGSRVMLNAESTLQFPSVFSTNKREVKLLKGEAYFEVNKVQAEGKKSVPFYVLSGEQIIEVLGTLFNVNAYDQQEVQTTLLEGSVQIGGDAENSKSRIKPGEQHVYNSKSGKSFIREVSLNPIFAWKDGYFLFENADLKTVLDAYSRWYNVEVEYDSSKVNFEFVGKIPRNTSFETALEVLKTTGVRYILSGNKLIIN